MRSPRTKTATRFVGAVLVGVALLSLAACREPRTPAQSIAALDDPNPDERQRAADALRTDSGVPKEAIQPLIDHYGREQVPKVRGAILITLGRSGAPEAKPLIDQAIPTEDRDMRRWAGRALKYWMIQNGQIAETHEFPDGWPYGQPGFPPKLPDN